MKFLFFGAVVVGVVAAPWLMSKADAHPCSFVEQLSPYQQQVAYKAYRAGEPYGLGLTTVAIAWQESKLGLYKVRFNSNNVNDTSVGTMHTVAKWKTHKMSPFAAGQWMQLMIESDDKSLGVGVQDLLYWRSRSQSWGEMVGHYNGGNKPNSKYTHDIIDIVHRLKHCKF